MQLGLENLKDLSLDDRIPVNDGYKYFAYKNPKETFGLGEQGDYIGRDKKRDRFVVVKRITRDSIPDQDQTYRHLETQIIKQLNHPNVIRWLDYHITDGYEYIITELIENGSLQTFIKVNPTYYKEEGHLNGAIVQILKGLSYIHANNLKHRDIRLGNILVSAEYTIKIAGKLSISFKWCIKLTNDILCLKTTLLGLEYCELADLEKTIFSQHGNPLYFGPDYYIDPVTIQNDLWMTGITLLFFCCNVFIGDSLLQFYQKFERHQRSVSESRSVSNIDMYQAIPKIYLETIDLCLSGTSTIPAILQHLVPIPLTLSPDTDDIEKQQQQQPSVAKGPGFKMAKDRYQYATSKVLGSGRQAIVYKGWDVQNFYKRVAVKCFVNVRRSMSNVFSIPREEFVIIQGLDHPNVLRYLDYSIHEESNLTNECIIMERMKHKSLSYFMDKEPHYFQNGTNLRQAIGQILKGVQYLHNNKIIHRDIKPGNILVSKDYTLKICDFGMSKYEEGVRDDSTQVGSPLFLAPLSDLINGTTVQTDLWSVGITMLLLLL
ncbi:protein kinase [Cavenderia fasciculata]|uniref:Protein kinase n=1 Tax=Cavenderia fasciculata TaxID=261658 RepID=F4QCZ7_CACFS|nr:protein kinase [Cavenderia fasciculata]EGG13678.1 protein kinase [Cavenderia fasciculata]|eukprot:XP_004350382.1 protein kinase [Cavenderia fasciculata]